MSRKITGINEGKKQEDERSRKLTALTVAFVRKVKLKYLKIEISRGGSSASIGLGAYDIDGMPSIRFDHDKREIAFSSTSMTENQAKHFVKLIDEVNKYKTEIFDYLAKKEELLYA